VSGTALAAGVLWSALAWFTIDVRKQSSHNYRRHASIPDQGREQGNRTAKNGCLGIAGIVSCLNTVCHRILQFSLSKDMHLSPSRSTHRAFGDSRIIKRVIIGMIGICYVCSHIASASLGTPPNHVSGNGARRPNCRDDALDDAVWASCLKIVTLRHPSAGRGENRRGR
jgi:hypothetical protein